MKKMMQQGSLFVMTFGCLLFWLLTAPPSKSIARNDMNLQNSQEANALFAKNCATCHGKDGRAKTFKAKFNKARNLTDAPWQEGVSDERLFNSITNGRGKMPAFGKKLSEADIGKLVVYIRTLKK
jgi:cbb3-type cytochrome c oxidase subunit III